MPARSSWQLSKAPATVDFSVCRENTQALMQGCRAPQELRREALVREAVSGGFSETQVARRGGPSLSHSLPGLAGPAPLQLVLVQCNQTEMTLHATYWHPPFQLRNNEAGSLSSLELPYPLPGQARRADNVEIPAWQQYPSHKGVLPEP